MLRAPCLRATDVLKADLSDPGGAVAASCPLEDTGLSLSDSLLGLRAFFALESPGGLLVVGLRRCGGVSPSALLAVSTMRNFCTERIFAARRSARANTAVISLVDKAASAMPAPPDRFEVSRERPCALPPASSCTRLRDQRTEFPPRPPLRLSSGSRSASSMDNDPLSSRRLRDLCLRLLPL